MYAVLTCGRNEACTVQINRGTLSQQLDFRDDRLKCFSFVSQVLHNIDPINGFAAIRVERYKLVLNQDGFYKSTWYPRYEVPGELDTSPQPCTLPGAVIQCGEWNSSIESACNSAVFPCLFDIEEGTK